MNSLVKFIVFIFVSCCVVLETSAQIFSQQIIANPSDNPVAPGAIVQYEFDGLILDGPQYRWTISPSGLTQGIPLQLSTKIIEVTWSNNPQAPSAQVSFQYRTGLGEWQDYTDPYLLTFESLCDPNAVINGPFNNVVCIGEPALFNIDGATVGQYTWGYSPGAMVLPSVPPSLALSYSLPGTYVITATNNNTCLTEPEPFVLTVEDPPVINGFTSSVDEGCVGDDQLFILDVSGDYTSITWEVQGSNQDYLTITPQADPREAIVDFDQSTSNLPGGKANFRALVDGCQSEELPWDVTINLTPSTPVCTTCPAEVCHNLPTFFSVSALNTNEYTWDISPAGSVNISYVPGTMQSQAMLTGLTLGTKNVTITPNSGQCSGTPLNFSFEVEEDKKLESYTYSHTELNDRGTERLFINSCRERSSHCTENLTELDLYAVIDVGASYNWGDQTTFSVDAEFDIFLFDKSSETNPSTTFNFEFHIDKDQPRQVFHKKVTGSLNDLRSIWIFPLQYNFTDLVNTNDVSVKFYYVEQREIDAAAAEINLISPTPTSGLPSNWEQTFTWEIANSEECYQVPQYEFQLIRVFDGQMVETNSSWSKALSVFTESSDPSITLTIPEGSGEYKWQVRPIGSLAGGVSNPLNLTDKWASTPDAITIENPDGNNNWIYSRTFTERNKTNEQLTFANGLQQVQQQQTKVGDHVVVTQTYQDYAGRDAVSTLPFPQIGANNRLGRKVFSFLNLSLTEFSTYDFDYNPLDPDGMLGNGYYQGI
ncbi:MAG: hypothetical protein AAF843_19265, partial [Bacteroidota bacterium]